MVNIQVEVGTGCHLLYVMKTVSFMWALPSINALGFLVLVMSMYAARRKCPSAYAGLTPVRPYQLILLLHQPTPRPSLMSNTHAPGRHWTLYRCSYRRRNKPGAPAKKGGKASTPRTTEDPEQEPAVPRGLTAYGAPTGPEADVEHGATVVEYPLPRTSCHHADAGASHPGA